MLEIERHMVAGVFEDRAHADQAFMALRRAGFGGDQLRVVVREELPVDTEAVRVQREGYAGAWLGTLIGAGLGAGLGIVVGVLAFTVTSLLALCAFVGLLAGAALGVYAGPFFAMEAEERKCEKEPVASGRTIVLVRTESRQKDAESILLHHGAYDDSMSAF